VAIHVTGVVDKVIVAYFQFFSGFCLPKTIKIGSFLTELIKTKYSSVFLKHGVHSVSEFDTDVGLLFRPHRTLGVEVAYCYTHRTFCVLQWRI